MVDIWFTLTALVTEAAAKNLTCTHGSNVFSCPACTELLPTSFWNRMTWTRFAPEKNTYHVTALTGCLRKSYLDVTSPAADTVESAWAKLRGSLLHYAGRSLGWNELRVKMTFELDDETISIIGFIDAFDPDTGTLFDLKTTRFVKWQKEKGFIPRENHAAQVQCYYTILETYGIPVSRLVLVYVDDKEIVPVAVPIGNRREWMMRRAAQLHRAFTKHEVPKPEVGSSCKYCPHRETCPQVEGVKFGEAMS